MSFKPNEGTVAVITKTLELMSPNEDNSDKARDMANQMPLGLFIEVFARLAVENASILSEHFKQEIQFDNEESPT